MVSSVVTEDEKTTAREAVETSTEELENVIETSESSYDELSDADKITFDSKIKEVTTQV